MQEGNRKLGEDLKASRETTEGHIKLIKVLSYVMLSDKIQFLFHLIVQEGNVAWYFVFLKKVPFLYLSVNCTRC